jgi:hypothetical protein
MRPDYHDLLQEAFDTEDTEGTRQTLIIMSAAYERQV